ncbi:autotransporter outer membrane beta-barrel domain-containing protein [Ochrobactrum sp. Q0168]|uniref:autotransporter family protein n=1 Tax=Ochrobactrum sp. Q0168 TaxID=2793241 RepID=UPI0018EA5DCD|nr:autotransporter outer membrane beta-barrel domain-containing protein [Ochrobactrum sp. Q0168]
MFNLSTKRSGKSIKQLQASLLSSVALLTTISYSPGVKAAGQVLADGITVTASGEINTGTTGGTDGIALLARDGGNIQSFSPLTIITGGVNAIGAQSIRGSQINLFNGSTIHTTGSGADGIVSTGGSIVTVEGTDIWVDNVGYGLITGTSGYIEMRNSTVNTKIATGAAAFSNSQISLTDSMIETESGLALWIEAPNSRITGSGLTVISNGERGAVVLQGTLSLTKSSIESNWSGIQTGNAATINLTDTSITTTGTSASGIYLTQDSKLTMNGGSISTSGAGSRALYGATGNNTAQITGAEITAAQASAIRVFGSTAFLDLTLDSSSVTGNSDVIEVVSGGRLDLNASDSELTGAAQTEAGSTSNVSLSAETKWNVTGDSNITNLNNADSLIQFSAPDGGTYKKLTAGSYVGSAGQIGINTYLDTDGSPSDRLIIDGGAASGSTRLLVANAGGQGALTTGNGILVVDTENGGTTGAGAFHLVAPVVAGPYEYSLYRSSVDASGEQNWYLRSKLPPVPPDPPVPPAPPVPPVPPVPDPTPDYRPEVSLYAAIPSMGAIYGRQLIGSFHERVGEEEQLKGRTDIGADPKFNGYWVRGLGHSGHRNGDTNGIYDGAPEYDYRFGAIQAGLDFYRHEADNVTDHAGMYLAYGHGRMDVTQNRLIETRDAGQNDFDAYSVGAYWTRLGENGWYLDGVVQGTWYDMTTSSNRATEFGFPDQSVKGFGFAASLEGGYPFDLGNQWQIEPQAQLVWQTINFDDFNDGAADIRYDDLNSVAGRIGARISRTWAVEEATATEPARLATVWGRVNLWHEFTAKAQVDISSATGFVPFSSDLEETWVEIGGGATRQISKNMSLYGNVSYSTTFDVDNYAWNGKLGMRVNW